ncbi:MAG TPA: hypothetical protein VGM25_13480 [Caulobacteraceae bacterium]|jgi:hypothetical protein
MYVTPLPADRSANQTRTTAVLFADGAEGAWNARDEALLNEALEESFPASDPLSSLRYD